MDNGWNHRNSSSGDTQVSKKGSRQNESASMCIIDSCSVRMNATSGMDRGIDGNKKIKGLKRHVIVDSLGLIIDVVVHAANIHDSKGATQVLEKLNGSRHDEPKLQQIFADAGYRGKLIKWVKKTLKMNMTIVKQTDKTVKWAVQPKHWIIERTFAWLLNFRRLVINYEMRELPNLPSVTFIWL